MVETVTSAVHIPRAILPPGGYGAGLCAGAVDAPGRGRVDRRCLGLLTEAITILALEGHTREDD